MFKCTTEQKPPIAIKLLNHNKINMNQLHSCFLPLSISFCRTGYGNIFLGCLIFICEQQKYSKLLKSKMYSIDYWIAQFFKKWKSKMCLQNRNNCRLLDNENWSWKWLLLFLEYSYSLPCWCDNWCKLKFQ